VANLRAVLAIDPHFTLFGRVDNVLDRHYYTFGTLGQPGDVFPQFHDARFLSPAQPRGAWVGARVAL
jgi:outer membrane receptor protein involved in Fe transport